MDVYRDVADRLRDSGFAYECFCTPEELEERREAARAAGRTQGYEGTCRGLTEDEREARRAEGRSAVLRFAMPDKDFTWDDLVRGPLTFQREHVPDYVIVRANGDPLYTLVNPVDDAMMRITHVLRGEDLLSSTPRQLAMHEALAAIGVTDGPVPLYGHLPYVMGEGNRKLSKRDPESSLLMYRREGYLPEGLLNYLALLGWSLGGDQEFFSMAQMAEAFEISRVNPNPARFDLKKCTAINADWIRALSVPDLTERIVPFLVEAGLIADSPTSQERRVLEAAVPLVQERMETLRQAPGMLGFLLVSDDEFAIDAAEDLSGEPEQEVVSAAHAALAALADANTWTAPAIEAALRAALIDGLGRKPRHAFGPVRIAVTGRRVSPPLFESVEILGPTSTLHRLASARQ
jgi:glutamyl-tRNA synthetase